ncbi:expressed unknown protein [Seminavis robusta]|uniref:Disintegrin domain-containing protein n=1 Tax=Seminavis robusta TaxID=568900 RepID=A0A9N8H7W3_9STRA|nr:expressed unknown protein [Seminavis robusta]|eukprot:Sro152_g069460.1 n/a (774) ;mRNA; r:47795-50603
MKYQKRGWKNEELLLILLLPLLLSTVRAQGQLYFANQVNERAGPCPDDPLQIGYRHIIDVNIDQRSELERIDSGEAPRTPYVFPLCNSFKYLIEQEMLEVVLPEATFVCGYNGSNQELCVLEGGDVQVMVYESTTTADMKVTFQGLTFAEFNNETIQVLGPSTITFNDARWWTTADSASWAVRVGTGTNVVINSGTVREGQFANPIFYNAGGTLAVDGLVIGEGVRAPSVVHTTDGGESTLTNMNVTMADLVRVTETTEIGSYLTASQIVVSEMNSLGSVFFVEGTGSGLAARDVQVVNNRLADAFMQTQTSRNFNVLIATEESTATLTNVLVSQNDGMDRVFSASRGADVGVIDAVVSDVVGTSPPDLLSNIAMAEDGGSMNVMRLQVSDITSFSAVYFAICGSHIQVVQSCIHGGRVATPAFVSADSTFSGEGNYIASEDSVAKATKIVLADRCGNVETAVFSETSLDSTCFSQTGTGSCEGSCVEGFADSTQCLAAESATISLTPQPPPSPPPNLSCPASPPTPVPTLPPTIPPSLSELPKPVPRPDESPCRANFQCSSGYCSVNRICEPQKQTGSPCDSHQACASGRCSSDVCIVQEPPGSACLVHEDCDEGYCSEASSCLPLRGKEESCDEDAECRSGRCTLNPRRCTFTIQEGALCGKDADCFDGRCKKDRGINQCVARKENGDECVDNSDCLSLRCENQICAEPVGLEESCDEPSDCYSLFCNAARRECVLCSNEIEATDDTEPNDLEYGISGSAVAELANGCLNV